VTIDELITVTALLSGVVVTAYGLVITWRATRQK